MDVGNAASSCQSLRLHECFDEVADGKIKISFEPVLTRMRIGCHLRVRNRLDCQNARNVHALDAEQPSDILYFLLNTEHSVSHLGK